MADRKTITVEMTHQEAHAVLRALAVANSKPEETPKEDVGPNTWVAERILRILDLKG